MSIPVHKKTLLHHKALTPLRAGCVLLLIILHAFLALSAASTKSATFDETIHLIGGISFWKFNDYRVHPENGNLAQRIIALPNVLLPGFPEGMEKDPDWKIGAGVPVATRFIFGDNIDYQTLIFRGRFMVTLASCALALTVFFAAYRLWGFYAAIVALAAYAFHPVMLANAALMTSDLLAAFAFTLATWAFWICLHKLTTFRLAALIASAASMALMKVSYPIFFPIAFVMASITLWRNLPWRIDLPYFQKRITTRKARATVTLAITAATIVGVWFFVWAALSFRYQAKAPDFANDPGGFFIPMDTLITSTGLLGKTLAFLNHWHIFPEAYLYGMACIFHFTSGRFSLICGEYFLSGVWWFYPATLFYKTPLPILALLPLTLLGLASIRRRRLLIKLYQASPWLCLFLIFMAVAMVSPLNVGIRHILPAIPAALILLGYTAVALAHRPIVTRAIALFFCLVLLTNSAWAWPNYISNFNAFAGPSKNLYRNFSDSNLDWGQDLPALNTWARANIIEYHDNASSGPPPSLHGPLFTSYFGSANVAAYGVPGQRFQCYYQQPDESPLPVPYAPGIYAISASRLMLFPSFYGPSWSDYRDHAYVERRDFLLRFFSADPDSPERAQIQGTLTRSQIGKLLQEFETLRFCRLCAFLRQREPLHQINGTILIFQLTQEDLQRYFFGPSPGNGPVIHNQPPDSSTDLPIR